MNTKRRPLTLLVDEEVIEELKAHRENLSKIAEEAFKARLREIKGKSGTSRTREPRLTNPENLNKGKENAIQLVNIVDPKTDSIFKLPSADHNVQTRHG